MTARFIAQATPGGKGGGKGGQGGKHDMMEHVVAAVWVMGNENVTRLILYI